MTVDLKHKPVLLNQTYKQVSLSSSSLPTSTHVQTAPSAARSVYQCFRLNRLAMKQFLVTLLLIFGCVSITLAQGRETGSFYYYEDAKGFHEVDAKNNEIGQNSNFESLINKDFFTIYSSNDKILNSVENHSRNNDQLSEKIYATNIDPDDAEFSPNNNPIPIAKFRPAFLDFKEQEIGIAKSARVVITNLGEDELNFESISGSTIHFYCNFFTQKVIPSGGNTSFDVHFLARELGLTQSAIYINTNKGIIKYNVQGAGIENIYKLKPVLNARILLNTSFTSHIHLHNPHNYSLQVVEIFTSDDDLHLEMPLYSAVDNMETTTTTTPVNIESASLEYQKILIKNNNSNQIKKKSYLKYYTNKNSSNIKQLWNLRPFESKSIAMIRYMGRQANNHTAFISVVANLIEEQLGETQKTGSQQQQQTEEKKKEKNIVNSSISFTLPVEIEVTEQPGIYSPLKIIDFGAMSLSDYVNKSLDEYSRWLFDKPDTVYRELIYFSQRVNSSVRTVDLYIVNSAPRPLVITDVYSVRHNSALNILVYENIEVPADTKVLTKVAEIKFDPTKSKRSSQNYGKIIVATNDKNIWLQISFVADLHKGSLEYNKEQANFYTSMSSREGNNNKGARLKLQSLELKNNYSFPIVVFNISLNRNAMEYFEIRDFTSPILLPQSQNYKPVFRIKFDLNKFLENNSKNNRTEPIGQENFSIFTCIVRTNFTSLEIPLHVYDGQLSFDILNNASINKSVLFLNPIQTNSTKDIPIHINNFNPIDIKFASFEINKITSKQQSKAIKNNLSVKLVRFEPLSAGSEHRQIYINQTFEREDITKKLKIPALHRMLVLLTVDTSYLGNDPNFVNSLLYEYELAISTKHQPTTKLRIEFTVVNGALDLVGVSSTDSKHTETLSNHLEVSAFPTRLSVYPLKIRSRFASDLQVSSVEFQGFGEAFTFNWFRENESVLGRVKSNTTSILGQIQFSPQFTCIPFCYLGLAPRKRVSIIDRTSLFLQRIEDINTNTEKSQIYDLWIKSCTLKPIPSVKSKRDEALTTFEVDSFLFTFLREHWHLLIKHGEDFLSSMTVLLKHESNSNSLFSYRFPIELKFKWPRLVQGESITEFALTQVHSDVSSRNVTVFNPSNSNVLVQVMLASNYAQRRSLYEFVETHEGFFYGSKHQAIMKSLIQRAGERESDKKSSFRIRLNHVWNTSPNSKTNEPTDITEDPSEEFEQLNIQPDTKNSFVFVLRPNKEINLQVEFYPEKMGTFEDLLIIRNNLTILDVQTISAQVGTADLRINNLPPMRSSLFFNNQMSKSTPIHFQTTDYSNIIMQMNKNDFEHCTSPQADFDTDQFLHSQLTDQYSHILNKIFHDDSQEPTVKVENNTKDGVELVFMSQELSSSYENNYKSSFKFKDGIVLRGHLILKNIGSTHLNVMNVIFDGESCFSRGIEVTYCNPFSIAPFDAMAPLNESVFLLEIRYRPDFTMANIKKSLVLETNIGELRYSIEIQIPHYMLSTCHDSLPRPPLEGYLFYLGISLVALLMLVMLLTSMVESRSIIKYQYEIYKQIYSMSETKQWFSGITSDNEEYDETSTAKECQTTTTKAHTNHKANNKKVVNHNEHQKKSSHKSKAQQQHNQQNSHPESSSPRQNHSHRNLTKATGNQRSTAGNNHMSSDSSVSSSSSSSVSKKQNVNSSPKAEKVKHQVQHQVDTTTTCALTVCTTNQSDEQKTKVATAPTSPAIASPNQTKTASASGPSTPNTNSTSNASKSAAKGSTKATNNSRPATPLANSTPTAVVETVKPVEPPISKKMIKAMTAASIQNDTMANQRKAYLNQQKSQLKTSKSTSNVEVKTAGNPNQKSESPHPNHKSNNHNGNSHKLPSSSHGSLNGADHSLSKATVNSQQTKVKTSHNNQAPFEHTGNKNGMNNTSNSSKSSAKHLNIGAALFSPAETYLPGSQYSPHTSKLNAHSNHLSEKLEIEILNNQLQQLQQQKQQISYLNGASSSSKVTAHGNQSESSSSPSPTSSISSSTSNRKRVQHQQSKQKSELFDMIMNYTNRFDNNAAYDYDSMVAQTEDFKQTILDNQPHNQSSGSPFSASDIQPSPVEQQLRNNELDKILYSLITQESNRNTSQDGFANFPNNSGAINSGFLGPIQRPSNTYSPNLRSYENLLGFNNGNDQYDKDPFEHTSDIKLNNQYSVGSNLKLTGEYIAILNALFSAKSQEMANSNNNSVNKQTRSMLNPSLTASNTTTINNSDQASQSIPVKQPLHKAKSLSNDRTRFQEFRLFENSNSSSAANNKSSLLLESSFSNPGTLPTSSASYWPMTSDSGLTGKDSARTTSNSSAPWNSVLLNDFDDFAAPSSLNNSSTGNHIKSLWATSDKSNKQEQSQPTAAEVLANKKKL